MTDIENTEMENIENTIDEIVNEEVAFQIGQIFDKHPGGECAVWCNKNQAMIVKKNETYTIETVPLPQITVEDYDIALEQHLLQTRYQRGYTTRQPSYYLNSSVPRWKQDALDWVSFLDSCMLYGLKVQNNYKLGNGAPTLWEFKKNLPKIVWSYDQDI